MKTYPLLEKAPPHDSLEFVDYLREHNKVLEENSDWIVIENCKYHTEKTPWYTAFLKGDSQYLGWQNLGLLWAMLPAEMQYWNWLKKSADKQTVKRFHVHIYK